MATLGFQKKRMEKSPNKTPFLIAPVLAASCLGGYLLLDALHINVKILVALFWLSLAAAIVSLFVRGARASLKYSAIGLVPVLLYVPASSVFAWTAWWVNGFGP